jgi:hypothetical protein
MPGFAVFDLFPEKKKKKDQQCKKDGTTRKENGIGKRMDEFSLEARVNMVVEVIPQCPDLGKNCQKEQEEENDHVQCPFSDDGSKGFIEWDLLIFCKDAAAGHFAEPWKSHIGKITDHDRVKGVFKRGTISHRFQKDHPA